ncbi:hypothetical protein [Paenibacillus alvei]|uniref:hypothetical protein n=1 Tax=Paenibacillus alvei TaxID=44250 RepID=UPI0003865027|nr:hypothetical protein [Paenibacillus alvei]EPY11274.1 hypothetical protein PAAL66ix_18964 [Paenibacillus alvei A6-6i-x]
MFEDIFLRNGFHNRINSYDSYILDSNIVIKFRELFYSPHKMNADEISYYIGLLDFFRDKDVVPGFAIQELSWDFERFEIDTIKQTRLLDAIDTLFSYDESTISRIKAQREYISEVKPIKNGKKKLNSLSLNAEANMFLLPSFCVMLKYHHVLRVCSDNKNRYKEICNFIMNKLKLVGAYELALITDLLFSRDNARNNAIKSMLKIETESHLLKAVWNSCWDIFFLRFITGFAANTLSNRPTQQIHNPILVTRDINLHNVGSQLENNIEMLIDDQVFPGVSGGFEYSKEDEQLVLEMYHVILQTRKARIVEFHSMSEDQRISHWIEIINNLENELEKVYQ